MLLAVDIGNSEITIGLNDQQRWKHVWRLPSHQKHELYFGIQLQDFFLEEGISRGEIQHVVLSSVVPDLTEIWFNVLRTLFKDDPVIVNADIYDKLPIKVLNPYQIGSDLVANALAAYTHFKGACVVVDFGTALTFTTVGPDAAIAGVAIAPGLKTALKALSENTAKLFEVPLEMPTSVLGRGTVHAIQAGILFSYEGAVKNVLNRINEEMGTRLSSVATGGLVNVIPSIKETVDIIEPRLTLNGLKEIYHIVRS